MSCIAIVLQGPKVKNGRRVFDSLVQSNRECIWNSELVTASEGLVYMGLLRPSTIFVSASNAHLEVLRSAWARRVLKPADGYSIRTLGLMGEMEEVEQVHYVPLADVICDAISRLNKNGQAASLDALRVHISRHCTNIAPPSTEVLQQTVASLVATGIVYRMGQHFFLSISTKPTPKVKASVECQTGTSMMVPAAAAVESKKERRGLLERLFRRGNGQPTAAVAPAAASAPPVSVSAAVPQPPAVPSAKPTAKMAVRQVRPKMREPPRIVDRASSSECLDYGPIDPPETLPTKIEVIESRTRRRPRRVARTSTPVESSDSAYSPSHSESNDEPISEPEAVRSETPDHTYINLHGNDSTQFETLNTFICPPMHDVHISNV